MKDLNSWQEFLIELVYLICQGGFIIEPKLRDGQYKKKNKMHFVYEI